MPRRRFSHSGLPFLVLPLGVLGLFLLLSHAIAEEGDRIEISSNQPKIAAETGEELRTTLRVEAKDDEIQWGDIFRGVARMNGYDDQTIQHAIPQGGFQTQGRFARWGQSIFNWVMSPCFECNLKSDSNGPAMEVVVHRERALAAVQEIKSQIRSAWSQIEFRENYPHYGLEGLPAALRGNALELDAESLPPPQRLIVLIHGLNSRPEALGGLHDTVSDVCQRNPDNVKVTFRYPNDQSISSSAELLSKELKAIQRCSPTTKVQLVTHSMGGLVARQMLEQPPLDPQNVSRLIMIAPPNQGSSLASIANFMDCYECFTSPDRRRPGVIVDAVTDGLGEAATDLTPGSVFLDRLNAMPRNDRVQYTILLGSKGPLAPSEIDSLRQTVKEWTSIGEVIPFAASKLNSTLARLDEVVEGNGDGVVSIECGQLDGVKDVITLPFTHAGVLSLRTAADRQAHELVKERLLRP